MKTATAVLFGGKSCEHDISIITACGLGGALAGAKKIYIDQFNKWWYVRKTLTPREYKGKKKLFTFIPVILLPNDDRLYAKFGWFLFPLFRIGAAVMCFHGLNGEDGSVQGLLQLAGVPYTGSEIAASAVGMDKMLSKRFFNSLGLPTLPAKLIRRESYLADGIALDGLDFPLIVKPNSLGSSIGISVAKTPAELESALDVAFAFDNNALVEAALEGAHESNCCYFCGGVSDVFTPLTTGEILSFADKYLGGEKHTQKRETEFVGEIQAAAKLVCETLGVGGAARVDFLVAGEKWYVNEINTIPGSLGYTLWQDKYSPKEFAQKLIDDALSSASMRINLTLGYQSSVLEGGKLKK